MSSERSNTTDLHDDGRKEPSEDRLSLNVATLNCRGLKGTLPYVKSMCNDHSVVFVCEHWLRPGELPLVVESDFSSHWTHLKSSMNPTELSAGRPFGGCGFICKKKKGCIVYRPLPCTSDRICGIEVILAQKPVLCIFGVYMPYNDSRACNEVTYLETLQELQGYMDSCSPTPTMVVGDFNTQLPQAQVLSKKWYRGKGFTRRSALLYNFMCENELRVANFSFPQAVNFTWCNSKHRSYIDHVLITDHLLECVMNCKILNDDEENMSDHFAVECNLALAASEKKDDGTRLSIPLSHKNPNWELAEVKNRYRDALSVQLNSVCPIRMNAINTADAAKETINSVYSSLVKCIHNASDSAQSSQNSGSQQRRKKHWWTSDCTAARNRTRLFFFIWKSLGRPSHGVTYECYRKARKAYRRACRNAVNASKARHNGLLTKLYKTKRAGQFWNLIRKSRSKKTDFDAISVDRLTSHFTTKFTAPTGTSTFIEEAEKQVLAKCSHIKDVCYDHICISEQRCVRLIKKLRSGCSPGVDGVRAEHLRHSIGTSLPLHLCLLLTLCLRFGLVPDNFCIGQLIPILKKPQSDPSNAANYRPIITVSQRPL